MVDYVDVADVFHYLHPHILQHPTCSSSHTAQQVAAPATWTYADHGSRGRASACVGCSCGDGFYFQLKWMVN
jgi:hypothetical protein